MTITAISNANPGVVTTAANHNLSTGQIVRLTIPKNYGMQEINRVNNRLFSITVLSLTTFSLQVSQCSPQGNINLDTTLFSAFVNVGTGTPATAFPVGSGPTPITSPPQYATNKMCDSLIGDATMNNSTSEIPF